MATARVIKKYPNRRLYDTEESRYITLGDVRDLVLGDTEFVVIDKKTGEDITRSILLQVIIEQDQQGEAIMSEAFLSQVIRSCGKAVPGFVADYLEKSLKLFLAQRQHACDQAKPVVRVEPVSAAADTRQTFNRWQSLQEEVLHYFTRNPGDTHISQEDAGSGDRKKTG